MTWKADNIQGVIFTLPGAAQLDAQQVWEHIIKTLPETVQRPAMNPAGLSVASGPYLGFRLSVQSQLGRIDCILNAAPSIGPSPEPPTISDYGQALQQLDELLTRAISVVPPIRVATVAEFGRHFPSELEVVEFLSKETGGVWFAPPAQDCIYQINVRSGYPGDTGYQMNRLVTWSGALYAMVTAQLLNAGQTSGMSTTKTISAASLKIDVNSDTSFDIQSNASEMIKANSAEVLAIAAAGIRRLHKQ